MNQGRIIFAQLMDHFPKHEFDKLVGHYRAQYRTRQFSCLDQFLAMAFAQLTGRESLRDIQACLSALRGKLYHAGFRGRVTRSTLADANDRARRVASRPVDKTSGLACDQSVVLSVQASRRDYPEPLRRIVYIDQTTGRRRVFLTNHFELPALTVARLYKCRWQVELFFKWIKQHLRVKSFFGTSDNAVRAQIRIALGVYVLVAILKKRLDLHPSLCSILQVLRLTLFEKMPIKSALSDIREEDIDSINLSMHCEQLELFEL